MDKIERVDSLQELLKCSQGDVPVIYQLKPEERCPCHSKWTTEFLESVETKVAVHKSSNPRFFDLYNSPWELAKSALHRQASVGDLVKRRHLQGVNGEWEMISGADTHFVLENGPVSRWAELWKDCEAITKLIVPHIYRVGFWISCGQVQKDPSTTPTHLSTQMHFDYLGHHNLNFQIRGEKSIILFKPEDRPNLYPMPARLYALSRIDPRLPVDASHPLFAKAHPYHVDLKEGDVLFIPHGWWHHVTHKGDVNVNVTYWYHSEKLSGVKWSWSSLIVPNMLEAYYLTLKFVFALIFFLPPLMVAERMKQNMRGNKSLNLAYSFAVLSLTLVPLAVSRWFV